MTKTFDSNFEMKWPGWDEITLNLVKPIQLKPSQKNMSLGKALKGDMVIQGDNLPVMRSLNAKKDGLRGEVNFMLWDPPYNTGSKDFCYRDHSFKPKAEAERMQQELGLDSEGWVTESTAGRHSLWLSFMSIRLHMAQELLKPEGVIAVCIGYQEIFRLGLLMDQIFGEENRVGVITWEATTPKNDSKQLSLTSDYVLIYSKNKEIMTTNRLSRTEAMDALYKGPGNNADKDPRAWCSGDLSAKSGGDNSNFGIENPTTGEVHYPPKARYWVLSKESMLKHLNHWGIEYHIDSKGDLRTKTGGNREMAKAIFKKGPWPKLFFNGKKGEKRPNLKRYQDELRHDGYIPGNFWPRHESGMNRNASRMVADIVGGTERFSTPKPIELFKRLISLFCPLKGLVLDAFAGSGTTGHAVWELNQENPESHRRFLLIEGGTADSDSSNRVVKKRLDNLLSGKWADGKTHQKIGKKYSFFEGNGKINGRKMLESQHADLKQIIFQAHQEMTELDSEDYTYLIGKTEEGNGVALIWNQEGTTKLTLDNLEKIRSEGEEAGIRNPIHIFATANQGPSGHPSYRFFTIPDAILAALGADPLTEED